LHAIEKLDDRKAEPDQRDRSAYPDIIVRSTLSQVRIQPKWLSAVTLSSNLSALGAAR
jgi:hypothetical protein